jgi:hypothetical protein
MLLLWVHERGQRPGWLRRAALFGVGLALCGTILVITVLEKFREGGWITISVTSAFVALCFAIRAHYRAVGAKLAELDSSLADIPPEPNVVPAGPPDPAKQTAAVLVGSFGGLGVHTVLGVLATFPYHFENVLFLSIGVIDSGELKGERAVADVEARSVRCLEQYVEFARRLGFAAKGFHALGTDVVEEAEKLARRVCAEFPRTTFFSGQLVFQRETWYHRLLHNQTAYAIQRRLQWNGQAMVILPVRVR